MRAMILAAGRGVRMGHLTAQTPKALLKIKNHYLIEYSIMALAKIGITDIVINVCYCRDQIIETIGDGSRYGIRIHYSLEEEALETGGGIYQALPLLGDDPFIVTSCDILTDFPFETLPQLPNELGHIVLVNNPDFHPTGDFCLIDNRVFCGDDQRYTFSNIGIYRPEMFADRQLEKFRLGDLLKEKIQQQKITGEHYQGLWYNFGTPQQIEQFHSSSL